MILSGTLINVGTVLIGSLIGLALRSKLPKSMIKTVFQSLGLFTLFLGVKMGLSANDILIVVFSLVLGSILGQGINISKQLNRFSDYMKLKLKSKDEKFTEGMITAFLLYCVGSMATLGPIEEGLTGYSDLLTTKSVMDGFSSIALSAAMGIGVLFSIIPMFIYQGSLTLFAVYIAQFLPPMVIENLTAVGGILLIGIGISILEIKKLEVVNMLPALVFAVILSLLKINLNIG